MRSNVFLAAVCAPLCVSAGGGVVAGPVCPMIYQPVCAARGEISKTFANRCLAESAGYDVTAPGRCGENGARSRLRVKPIPASAAANHITLSDAPHRN